ncbi:MAG: ATP-binding cassette domain-containing protein [Ndongobacter sp.]|nr:ATP-binding cassette domain-containing protein [Ndongobacter sp.]
MIELQNVTKEIHGEQVLSRVSLTLEDGKIYGFVGQNGSGKTMLFRAICGLIHLTEGEVRIDGQPVDFQHMPKSVGLLLEAPAFLGNLTGVQNLKMLSYLTPGITDERIRDMLKQVGLTKAMDKRYGKYSLGMKQRLGLAYAFLSDPKIILLDEPTNALDARGIEILIEMIREYHDRGATILIASHDGAFLSSITANMISMEKGCVTGIRLE